MVTKLLLCDSLILLEIYWKLTLHVSPENKINQPSSNECSVMPWLQSMGIIHPVNQGGSSLRVPVLGAIPSIMFQAGQYVVDEGYSLVWREVVFCSCLQYIVSCFTSRTPCCCTRLLVLCMGVWQNCTPTTPTRVC